MSTASQNIRFLRKKYQFTQADMADKLGIKRSLLGAYEEARANPRLDVLVKAAEIFNVSVDQLVSGTLGNKMPIATPPARERFSLPEKKLNIPSQSNTYRQQEIAQTFNKDTPPLPASVQRLRLVPKSDFKQYFFNAVDQDYLAKLPELQLPLLPTSSSGYRAFEVADDSMQPVAQGSIVVGKKLDNVQHLQDGKNYVLITRTEGVMFRRVYNQIARSGQLLLETLHPGYESHKLSIMGREVEAWEVVLYISAQLSVPKIENTISDMSLPQLSSIVMDLQQEVSQLREMVRRT